jgi:hypothetical protein
VRGVVGKVELIYVDSASTDGSPRAVHFDAQVTVLHGRDLDRRTSPERGVATGVRGLHLFLYGDTILIPPFKQLSKSLNLTRALPSFGGIAETSTLCTRSTTAFLISTGSTLPGIRISGVEMS